MTFHCRKAPSKLSMIAPNKAYASSFCVGALLFLTLRIGARAQDYDSLIARARQQYNAKQFTDCLVTAGQAITSSPEKYKAYYYKAAALYSNNELDDAEKALAQALERAADEEKLIVGKLGKAIAYKRASLAAIKQGNDAMADGLVAKAGAAYRSAWLAGRLDPELGLKAASLLADRLAQPIDAAITYREVIDTYPDSPAAQTAADELAKLRPALNQAAQNLETEANRLDGGRKKELLLKAVEADPNDWTAYVSLAKMAATGNDKGGMYAMLKELSRRKRLNVAMLTSDSAYAPYLEEPDFQAFVSEALGSSQLTQLRVSAEQRREAGRRLQVETNERRMKAQQDYRDWINRITGDWKIDRGDSEHYGKCKFSGTLSITGSSAGEILVKGKFDCSFWPDDGTPNRYSVSINGSVRPSIVTVYFHESPQLGRSYYDTSGVGPADERPTGDDLLEFVVPAAITAKEPNNVNRNPRYTRVHFGPSFDTKKGLKNYDPHHMRLDRCLFFHLVSRTCGWNRVREAFLSCDTGLFSLL